MPADSGGSSSGPVGAGVQAVAAAAEAGPLSAPAAHDASPASAQPHPPGDDAATGTGTGTGAGAGPGAGTGTGALSGAGVPCPPSLRAVLMSVRAALRDARYRLEEVTLWTAEEMRAEPQQCIVQVVRGTCGDDGSGGGLDKDVDDEEVAAGLVPTDFLLGPHADHPQASQHTRMFQILRLLAIACSSLEYGWLPITRVEVASLPKESPALLSPFRLVVRGNLTLCWTPVTRALAQLIRGSQRATEARLAIKEEECLLGDVAAELDPQPADGPNVQAAVHANEVALPSAIDGTDHPSPPHAPVSLRSPTVVPKDARDSQPSTQVFSTTAQAPLHSSPSGDSHAGSRRLTIVRKRQRSGDMEEAIRAAENNLQGETPDSWLTTHERAGDEREAESKQETHTAVRQLFQLPPKKACSASKLALELFPTHSPPSTRKLGDGNNIVQSSALCDGARHREGRNVSPASTTM